MSLEVIDVDTAPNPTASIIILHGLGADGNDFVPVAQELDLGSVGRCDSSSRTGRRAR